MFYLAICILCTTYLGIFFKVSARLGLDRQQVIVFNYLTCVVTGFLMQQTPMPFSDTLKSSWIYWALIMGIGFITLFNLIAFSTQQIGMAITSVAYKLSLVIPFIFSVFLFREDVSLLKWLGIVLAVFAVILTCYPGANRTRNNGNRGLLYFLVPLIIFVGSGLLDAIIKYIEHYFLDGSNNDSFLTTAFGFAAFCGTLVLLINLLRKKTVLQPATIIAGILLGVPNYFSIWCLVQALKSFPGASSFIIPFNNMAVVFLSAIIAWFFFHEKLSRINWAGIILALISILLIADINL